MPTWGEVLKQLAKVEKERAALIAAGKGDPGASAADLLRRKYLRDLYKVTGRPAILYSTAWLENKPVPPTTLTVNLGDIQGFMEAVSNISEKKLDLILHSPGGSGEAAESIMAYLRTRFDHIRAIVPIAAMSAATMMALACDEIVMGSHSQLGPVDPQFTIATPEGPRSAPAQAIKDQFELAKTECQNPANIGAWLPILRSYAPGLLAQCDHAGDLAKIFVGTQLEKYMFNGDPDAAKKAGAAADWFADFTAFRSHGRGVSRDEARAQNIKVVDLEADSKLQDAVLSIHHATAVTYAFTAATKIVENHAGRAWLTLHQPQVIQMPMPVPVQLTPQQPPPGLLLPEQQPANRRWFGWFRRKGARQQRL